MDIFLTFRNADQTEGRGPMVPNEAFMHFEHAAEYIDEQPGIMGIRRKWSQEKGNGHWDIKKIRVHETSLIDQKKKLERIRKEALNKLTAEEKAALNLN